MSLIIMSGKNLPWGKGEGEGGRRAEWGGCEEESEGAASATSCFAVTGDLRALIAKLGLPP